MDLLYNKALKLGASDFGKSKNKNKRFYVIYDDKLINFGSKSGLTFYDHGDKIKRNNWIARHSMIKNKKGERVINNPKSASYWGYRLIWT